MSAKCCKTIMQSVMQQTILFKVPGRPSTRPLVILTGLDIEAKSTIPVSVCLSRALSKAWKWTRCNCTPVRLNMAATTAAGIAAKKSCKIPCNSDFSAYLCSAFHLNKATVSPTAAAAGLFYGRDSRRYNTSSVPCGALMRPLPCSRWNATGSGTFFIPSPAENIHTLSFI